MHKRDWNIRKKIFSILFVVSLAGNIFLIAKGIDGTGGGGQYKQSPNKRYTAVANSLSDINPLSKECNQIFGEFRIHEGSTVGKPIARALLYPAGVATDTGYREISDIIAWTPDSHEVTFTVPGASITLDIESIQDR